ncbi:hypothetical protein ACHAXN_007533 [Cyclotella atomus]
MEYEDNPKFANAQGEGPEPLANGSERPSAKSQVSFSLPQNIISDENHKSSRSLTPPSPADTDGLQLNNESEQSFKKNRGTVHNRRESFRAVERKGSRGKAGGRCSRLGAYIRERFSCLFADKNKSEAQDDQYYIPPPEDENESIFDAFHQLYSGAFDDLSMWLYGASFWKILLFYWTLYMLFVIIFVVFLYGVDRINLNDPTKSGGGCINSLREEGVLPLHAQLEFAFELSWTTFTTVGYGTIAPPGDEVDCYNVRTLCSIEAILGMAFVSMCSGLFYAKLTRLLGEAQVTFSSTLCVQYGKGLVDSGNRYKPLSDESYKQYVRQNSDPSVRNDDEKVYNPFPVLEFRVVNNRANMTRGKNEIFDAEISAIVQISLGNDSAVEGYENGELPSRWMSAHTTSRGSRKSQKVYYTLHFKPAFNPYFNRVWILQHTLDSSSPLLRREIRKELRLRGKDAGWDPSFNSYESIRSSLVEFSSIRVVLNGGSALSKSEVYAEKVYSYHDVCVGWQYVGVCYDVDATNDGCTMLGCGSKKQDSIEDEKATRVDFSLIHDIVPQRGGDFEPLDSEVEDIPQASLLGRATFIKLAR